MEEEKLAKLVTSKIKEIDRFTKIRKVEASKWRLTKGNAHLCFLFGTEIPGMGFRWGLEWIVREDLPVYALIRDAYMRVVDELNDMKISMNLSQRQVDFSFSLAESPKFPWDMSHLAPFYRIIPNNFRAQTWCERESNIRNNILLIHPDSPIPYECIPAALFKIQQSGFTFDQKAFSSPDLLQRIEEYKERASLTRDILGKSLPLS